MAGNPSNCAILNPQKGPFHQKIFPTRKSFSPGNPSRRDWTSFLVGNPSHREIRKSFTPENIFHREFLSTGKSLPPGNPSYREKILFTEKSLSLRFYHYHWEILPTAKSFPPGNPSYCAILNPQKGPFHQEIFPTRESFFTGKSFPPGLGILLSGKSFPPGNQEILGPPSGRLTLLGNGFIRWKASQTNIWNDIEALRVSFFKSFFNFFWDWPKFFEKFGFLKNFPVNWKNFPVAQATRTTQFWKVSLYMGFICQLSELTLLLLTSHVVLYWPLDIWSIQS